MQGFHRWHNLGRLSQIAKCCQSWMYVLQLVALGLIVGLPAEGHVLKEEAERVIRNVQVTKYSHELLIDEEKGIYEMDCSLFVSHVLQRIIPQALEGIPIETEVGRPRAGAFFQAIFNEVSGWKRISNLMETLPGDVIVWRENVYDAHTNSGHVMIVADYPTKTVERRVAVAIFDATGIPHARDSRQLKGNTGVGKGVIEFEVNAEGEPIGYYWSERMRKPRYKEIVIGRVGGVDGF